MPPKTTKITMDKAAPSVVVAVVAVAEAAVRK